MCQFWTITMSCEDNDKSSSLMKQGTSCVTWSSHSGNYHYQSTGMRHHDTVSHSRKSQLIFCLDQLNFLQLLIRTSAMESPHFKGNTIRFSHSRRNHKYNFQWSSCSLRVKILLLEIKLPLVVRKMYKTLLPLWHFYLHLHSFFVVIDFQK